MSTQLTPGLDVAQIVLYAFWFFFFGLVYWLRREDRREGYPLELDNPRRILPINPALIPPPKTFLLPHGGTATAPNFERDMREILATRTGDATGSALDPTGDPLLSGVGPASYAQRADVPEQTREGDDLIVPLRVAKGFAVNAGPDPRGWDVVGTDGKVAGKVSDVWVDRADVMVRYLEVELADPAVSGTRLLPITMLLLARDPKKVKVHALRADQFAKVPTLKSADRVTVLEEEMISAFYAGGRLYAEPKRLGPLL
jgi:photosynthetic reaction center H subunit